MEWVTDNPHECQQNHGLNGAALHVPPELAAEFASLNTEQQSSVLAKAKEHAELLVQISPVNYWGAIIDEIREPYDSLPPRPDESMNGSSGDAPKSKAKKESKRQGRAVLFPVIEPWPDPVDGAELMSELVAYLKRYVVLPQEAAVAGSLWLLHAHAHDQARISPILCISSPTPECGKSTLLALLQPVVPRPLPTANTSAAALFRTVEEYRPTLLIDEGDTFLNDKDELRGLLNSGHLKGGAYVVRVVGKPESMEARQFATWCPKAIALIGKLPESLRSRSIVIEMRRRMPGERIERLRLARLAEFSHLARKAARWVAGHADTLKVAEPALPDGLGDRALDNWEPLLAIADVVGGEWPEMARRAAMFLSAGQPETGGDPVQLLADIAEVWKERGVDRLSSSGLTEALVAIEGGRWADYFRGKPITATRVSRMLSEFGIKAKNIRFEAGVRKGFERDAFNDAFARYLPDRAATPLQPHTGAEKPACESATGETGVAVPNGEFGAPVSQCSGVAPPEGGSVVNGTCARCGSTGSWYDSGRRLCLLCDPPPALQSEAREPDAEPISLDDGLPF